MATVVAPETSDEPVTDGTESPEEEEATLAEQLATERKRLAGKDQALTRTQRERDAASREAARLRAKVAEFENSNLSELERAQAEAAQAKAEAAAARQEVQRAKLAAKYPGYATFIEQTAGLDEEDIAQMFQSIIEKSTPKAPVAPAAPAPRVDANQPRRTQPVPQTAGTMEELMALLKASPIPGVDG